MDAASDLVVVFLFFLFFVVVVVDVFFLLSLKIMACPIAPTAAPAVVDILVALILLPQGLFIGCAPVFIISAVVVRVVFLPPFPAAPFLPLPAQGLFLSPGVPLPLPPLLVVVVVLHRGGRNNAARSAPRRALRNSDAWGCRYS